MTKYEKLKQDTHNNIDKLMENIRCVENLYDVLSGKNQTQYKNVTIYQVLYTVGYLFIDGEIQLQSIETITDIEECFKDRFVEIVIEKIDEQIREEIAERKQDKKDSYYEGDR